MGIVRFCSVASTQCDVSNAIGEEEMNVPEIFYDSNPRLQTAQTGPAMRSTYYMDVRIPDWCVRAVAR